MLLHGCRNKVAEGLYFAHKSPQKLCSSTRLLPCDSKEAAVLWQHRATALLRQIASAA